MSNNALLICYKHHYYTNANPLNILGKRQMSHGHAALLLYRGREELYSITSCDFVELLLIAVKDSRHWYESLCQARVNSSGRTNNDIYKEGFSNTVQNILEDPNDSEEFIKIMGLQNIVFDNYISVFDREVGTRHLYINPIQVNTRVKANYSYLLEFLSELIKYKCYYDENTKYLKLSPFNDVTTPFLQIPCSENDQGRIKGLSYKKMLRYSEALEKGFDGFADYNFLLNNCCSSVYKILQAGGSDKIYYPLTKVWDPSSLYTYAKKVCNEILSQNNNDFRMSIYESFIVSEGVNIWTKEEFYEHSESEVSFYSNRYYELKQIDRCLIKIHMVLRLNEKIIPDNSILAPVNCNIGVLMVNIYEIKKNIASILFNRPKTKRAKSLYKLSSQLDSLINFLSKSGFKSSLDEYKNKAKESILNENSRQEITELLKDLKDKGDLSQKQYSAYTRLFFRSFFIAPLY